jgi:hypothetical protein
MIRSCTAESAISDRNVSAGGIDRVLLQARLRRYPRFPARHPLFEDLRASRNKVQRIHEGIRRWMWRPEGIDNQLILKRQCTEMELNLMSATFDGLHQPSFDP